MKLFSIISPSANLDALSQLCQSEDALLLRQDAVYLCLNNALIWPSTTQLYALATDVDVRQIQLPSTVTIIDDAQWVALCIAAKQNILWNI
jgi:sulfur relay protein TusB/DsrH